MSANKIDRSQLGDAQALARFQQSRQTAASEEHSAKLAAQAGEGQLAVPTGEKLEISNSAHKLAQLRDLMQAGRARLEDEEPGRAVKLETVKRRLQSGVYATAEVRDRVADRLTGLMRDLDALLE